MSRVLRNLYCWLVVLTMGAPLLVVAGVSVNSKKLMFFPPEGFSLRWYEELFVNRAWSDALVASLGIAFSAGLLALTVALPCAYFLWRYRVHYAKLLYGIGLLPFALPPVITGLGMLVFWAKLGGAGTVYAIAVGHGIFLVTLPMVMVSLGLESIDHEILEAAETMGADRTQTFLTIVLPLIAPYLFAGYAFAFVISMNEFIIAFFVGQFVVQTLPVRIFSSLRSGYSPTIASVSVMFMLLSVVVFSLVARFGDLPRLLGAWSSRSGA